MTAGNLIHTGCGGPVLGVMDEFILVTPLIGVSSNKLNAQRFEFMTLDMDIPRGETEIHLKYRCKGCGKIIPLDELEVQVSARCGICGELHQAKDLVVTDYVPFIDNDCMKDIAEENKKTDQPEVKKVLELPLRARRKKLADVLRLGIIF